MSQSVTWCSFGYSSLTLTGCLGGGGVLCFVLLSFISKQRVEPAWKVNELDKQIFCEGHTEADSNLKELEKQIGQVSWQAAGSGLLDGVGKPRVQHFMDIESPSDLRLPTGVTGSYLLPRWPRLPSRWGHSLTIKGLPRNGVRGVDGGSSTESSAVLHPGVAHAIL